MTICFQCPSCDRGQTSEGVELSDIDGKTKVRVLCGECLTVVTWPMKHIELDHAPVMDMVKLEADLDKIIDEQLKK